MKKLKENRSKSINLPRHSKRQRKHTSYKSPKSKRSLNEEKKEESKDVQNSINCGNCRTTLINSNLINRQHIVIQETSNTKSERKTHAQMISFKYEEDKDYYIFPSLIPNVFHCGDIEKPAAEGVFHLLKCKSCMHTLGKRFIFSQNKTYEGKYCFLKSSIINTTGTSMEEIRREIVKIREKRLEIDSKILSITKKIIKSISNTITLVNNYDTQYKQIVKSIEQLKTAVLAID